MFVDGVLVPIKHLINGTTIVQREVDSIVWRHVELRWHDVILAEGMPVETFLDSDDRSVFDNGAGVPETLGFLEPCAPRITQGALLERIRSGLRSRPVTCHVAVADQL